MKSLSGVLAFSALVALSVSSQGCAKLQEILKDRQPQKPANVRPGQDYSYSANFCDKTDTLGQAVKDTVRSVEASTEQSLAPSGSSVAKIQAERKAAGEDRSRCQIVEDVVEYGADYARGKNVAGTDAPMLKIENQQSFDLTTVASLSLTGLFLNTVRAESLAPLSKMTRLNTLWLMAIPFSDLSPLASVKTLRFLEIDNCALIRDLGPLVYLDGLEGLALTGIKVVATQSSYKPLTALKNLKSLDLRGSDFPSTSMLPPAKLEALYLDQQFFGDAELAQVASIYPGLKQLNYRTPLLRDLSPIARMTALVQLEIPAGSYANLDALRGLPTLSTLQVRDIGPTDVATLSTVPNLSVLSVDGPFRNVTDLAALQALRGIRSLNISYVGNIQGLDALVGLPALENLNFADYGGRIGSIAAIASMPKLVGLTLLYAKVQDISPLYGFLDSRKTAQVELTGVEIPRSQEAMNNSLREKFGSRYTGNVTIQH